MFYKPTLCGRLYLLALTRISLLLLCTPQLSSFSRARVQLYTLALYHPLYSPTHPSFLSLAKRERESARMAANNRTSYIYIYFKPVYTCVYMKESERERELVSSFLGFAHARFILPSKRHYGNIVALPAPRSIGMYNAVAVCL